MYNDARLITDAASDGLLHTGPCRLVGVVVGVAEAGATLSVYDSAAVAAPGAPVAVIDCAALREVNMGIALRRGLVVETTSPAGAQRVTVIWG